MDQSSQAPAARNPFAQTYFHGTKARLSIGDLIIPGHPCNYMDNRILSHVYVSATITAAIWGAELAAGSAPERIYLVEATGDVEDDPNVTDKRFPGNPTMSYRSASPFTVVGEVASWIPHSPAEIQVMRDNLKKLRESGQDTIID
ncbi:NAD(+)--rifampin ADP-ribosyltransferase [uncultured Flavobacterium sp.]|uniref:NAD(+)--rifampin ADP-ribosyltransferase n=1 Tax=uncultured Flavobacterium sp. TaxID=165435 RepID=UPI0025E10728|nr:NAD(+)--rifampin ADP-ribosyltransferase [uncultured Flavobacterium sp.]